MFHLAAQPLVRCSYAAPVETWATNVMGTLPARGLCKTARVQAIVAVTTDKCYQNREWFGATRERRLRRARSLQCVQSRRRTCAASYRNVFFEPQTAAARDGPRGQRDRRRRLVQDRLIPDLARAIARRPWKSARPMPRGRGSTCWNLCGYLLLGQQLLTRERRFAEAWNFGPDRAIVSPVSEVLTELALMAGSEVAQTDQAHPHEARLLSLDSAKARRSWHGDPLEP